ncbi:hypothetical protein SEVIR_7G267300v4 [Setaria viridis]|uniref:Epidermal patterning factor-like protein n=1 Tax=Setaria viridis TaxID=4556 RepID=A0A4U6U055_SETVI|nr:protein EPIDERMAL PATTERNING FACTOR 2 isoform X2 [Setaria italica]XP_034602640.1 protein EPIDERMAL PATTERNING FACTOR 2-like isoform X2 [Setaria viridis]TKW06843.1 hypothetical protein SEVIR_7G267300v2 [Setaria viridis]
MERHAAAARVHRVLLALAVVFLLAAVSDGIRPAPGDTKLEHGATTAEMTIPAMQGGGGGDSKDLLLREEVRATGSSLPDCSHACGACSPCSRVMVSFKCSVAEPLPCPMVYRCMCRGKCYPVPSS